MYILEVLQEISKMMTTTQLEEMTKKNTGFLRLYREVFAKELVNRTVYEKKSKRKDVEE